MKQELSLARVGESPACMPGEDVNLLSPHNSYCEHHGLTGLPTCRYTSFTVRANPYLRESEQFNARHQEVITDNRGTVTTTTFAQVIRQARRHDEEALVALYQRALPVIYRYALARLGRSDLVEDVVSEVFLVMVESIGELRTEQEAGFYAWLLQIAQGKISRALRHVTRNERRHIPMPGIQTSDQYVAVELMATDLVSNPVELHEWRETLEEVGLALGSLSAEQQVIVIGRFLAGQKIEDLAQVLGKQPGAVRVLQFRALNALAKHLGLARGSRRNGKGERS